MSKQKRKKRSEAQLQMPKLTYCACFFWCASPTLPIASEASGPQKSENLYLGENFKLFGCGPQLGPSPNQVLSRHCGRACSTSQEKHLFMNPHGKVRARGILNNPLTNWHHDSWCRWAHLYSPYFRLRRSRATASERAMVRAS